MPRTLASGMQTAVAAQVHAFADLVELTFLSGGTVRVTTAPCNLVTTTPAATWSGIGGVMSVGPVQEGTDPSGYGLDLTLDGVDQTILSYFLTDQWRGRAVKVYRAHVESNGTITADPLLIFEGNMNGALRLEEHPPGDALAGRCTLTMRCTDPMGELDQIRGIQTNVETHQALVSATDTFFSFVPTLINKRIQWGGAAAAEPVGSQRPQTARPRPGPWS